MKPLTAQEPVVGASDPHVVAASAFDAALDAASQGALNEAGVSRDATGGSQGQTQSQSQSSSPSPSRMAYRANGEHGSWSLDIDTPRAALSAAAAALVLVRAEPLLDAIDRWCEAAGLDAPDWTWRGPQPAAPTQGLAALVRDGADVRLRDGADVRLRDGADVRLRDDADVRLREGTHARARDGGVEPRTGDGASARTEACASSRWQPDGGRGATLAVPWTALRRLGPLPAPIGVQVAWQAAHAVCVFDRIDLDAHEVQCLEPGGAVVMPASFEPVWTARLRADGEADNAGLAIGLVVSGGVASAQVVPSRAVPAAPSRDVARAAQSHKDAPAAQPHDDVRAAPSRDDQRTARGWELRSLQGAMLSVDQLCGWTALDALPQTLFTRIELARPRPAASGTAGGMLGVMPATLIPWGRGHAAWLQGS